MKRIGLIGGMSWESSIVYYELINKKVKAVLGGFHSCKSLMDTVDFDQIVKLQHEDKWEELDEIMIDSAKRLEKAGADIIVLCTNTMHLCSPAIKANISIPFLHIAEATGMEIISKGIKKVALLGTKFTMEKDFYKEVLAKQFGIEVLIPTDAERAQVHQIIYGELVQGKIKDESRQIYQTIIQNLEDRGAEGVILGCTEIPLLISDSDVNIPTFDTTTLHAEKAVEWALKKD
ncbi:aspartate/glutamate racemase family protein [Ancylomarina euxinus]|uniref:Aspartate/glutamate racemase family protein n=1 Tax=Ancylomarina euxinus TaxID=2283627 RepID=A0A425XYJ0_9BACT|nr:aspartate/glutamate racemase family protein [Ancylomarina euxinus]MCZ4695746.1 aspartate/glutamate racemase family protein [Ancylomarina euxinus]MUP16199.1 amino acid racemase [Ancylomarina euxinus]RRG20060.1 aspartate/glutamate racemase family protein [Ancylomarina euxinus]